MRRQKTEEEKIVKNLSDIVSDVRIDLDQIGVYLARNSTLTYNRFMLIMESAEHEMEMKNVRQHDTLF